MEEKKQLYKTCIVDFPREKSHISRGVGEGGILLHFYSQFSGRKFYYEKKHSHFPGSAGLLEREKLLSGYNNAIHSVRGKHHF